MKKRRFAQQRLGIAPFGIGGVIHVESCQTSCAKEQRCPAGSQRTFCHQSQSHQLSDRRDLSEEPPQRSTGRGKGPGQAVCDQHHCRYHCLFRRYASGGGLLGGRIDQGRLHVHQRPSDHLCDHPRAQQRVSAPLSGESPAYAERPSMSSS